MDEILNLLGIKNVVSRGKNNTYTLDIFNSDEFGKYYSKIDNLSNVDYIEDMSSMTLLNSTSVWEYNNIMITLMADYEADRYQLILKEFEETE